MASGPTTFGVVMKEAAELKQEYSRVEEEACRRLREELSGSLMRGNPPRSYENRL